MDLIWSIMHEVEQALPAVQVALEGLGPTGAMIIFGLLVLWLRRAIR